MDRVQVIRCRACRKRRQSSNPCLQYLTNQRVTSVTNQRAYLARMSGPGGNMMLTSRAMFAGLISIAVLLKLT